MRNPWFVRVYLMELVFLLFFSQWYASRYVYLGGQLPFAVMVVAILALWGLIVGIGWWRDRHSAPQGSSVDMRSHP
jgi:hypothetical protein